MIALIYLIVRSKTVSPSRRRAMLWQEPEIACLTMAFQYKATNLDLIVEQCFLGQSQCQSFRAGVDIAFIASDIA